LLTTKTANEWPKVALILRASHRSPARTRQQLRAIEANIPIPVDIGRRKQPRGTSSLGWLAFAPHTVICTAFMPFQLSEASDAGLKLTPVLANQGCLRWFMGGFGLLAASIGGALLAHRYPLGADFANLLATLFCVLGTFFVGLSLFVMRAKGLGIAALVFDWRAAVLRVQADSGQPAEAQLPFAAIREVVTVQRSHSSSSSSGTYRRITYTHHAVLNLVDGAQWILTSENDPTAAEEQRVRLQEALDVARELPQALPSPPLPPTVACTSEGQAAVIEWQNPVTVGEVLGRLVVYCFFGTVLALFAAIIAIEALPVFAYLVLGFIATVFFFIVGRELWRLRQDARLRYGVLVGPDGLTYRERRQGTGAIVQAKSIALPDWYGASYALDATTAEVGKVLLLTQASQRQYLQLQQESLTFREIIDLLRNKQGMPALYFKNHTPTQHLAIAAWINRQAARYHRQAL